MFRSLRSMIRSLTRITRKDRRRAAKPASRMMAYRKFGLQLEHLEHREVPAAFTPGNLVVYQIGDGSAALSNAATAAFLVEFQTSGTPAGNTINVPTADSGANQALTNSGTASSEGALQRSGDGQYLTFGGYDAVPGTASIASTATTANARVFGRVDSNGVIDTSTTTTSLSGNNIRGVASNDGTQFWAVGGVSGVVYTPLGGSGTGTVVSTTQTNNRVAQVVNGQLYVSSGSGTNTTRGVNTVGTGLPTTTGQTMTRLPGLTDTLNPSSYGYFFADLDAGVSGLDTLYIADDGAGALQKFSLVGSTWTSNGIIGTTSDDYRGLTGVVSGTTVTLYAVRDNGAAADTVVSLVDSSGYNGAFTGTPTTIATASSAANIAWRGISLTPVSAGNINTTTSTPGISPTSGGPTTNITFTATVQATSGTVDPTGSVQFRDGGPSGTLLATDSTADGVADGTFNATFTTTVAVGTYSSVKAYYVPGSGFNVSNSAANGPTLTITATNPTTTTLNAVTTPIAAGTSATFTGTVTGTGSPTGTVEIRSGTSVVGSGTLDGSGNFNITVTNPTAGIYGTLAAFYLGDVNNAPSSSTPTQSLTVTSDRVTFNTGDIAFTAIQAQTTDKFSFVLLEDFDAGAVISFTDNAWDGLNILSNEGTVTLTLARNLAAGTQITYTDLGGTSAAFTLADGSRAGTAVKTSNFALNTDGDQILAYSGTITPNDPNSPLWVAGISTETWLISPAPLNTETSYLPTALSGNFGFTFGSTTNDGGYYSGASPVTGRASDARSTIYTLANWTIVNNLTTTVPSPAVFNVDNGWVVADFAFDVLATSQSEGNVANPTTFTVVRRGNLTNTTTVSYNTAFTGVGGTDADAADFTVVSPTALANFTAFQTTTTFTVNITGDATQESNETFAVQLSNPAGTSVLSSNYADGTHTITDDDGPAPTGLLLNEILANPPGTDAPNEYVELVNTTGAPINLGNVYLVVIEGENGTAAAGVADFVVNLSAAGSIPAGGTLTLRGSSNNLRDWSGVPSFIVSALNGGVIENGSNTYLLLHGPTAVVETTDYDIGNTGVLTLPVGTTILDSVGYQDSGAGTVYGPLLPRHAGATPDAISRVGGNTVANTTAWFYGDLETNLPLRYIEQTLPSNAPTGASITPGALNTTSPAGHIRFTSAGFSGNEGGTITYTVERVGGTAGDVSIIVTSNDILAAFPGTESFRATAGIDYTTINGGFGQVISWANGVGGAQSFTVNVSQDTDAEGNEAFELVLTGPTGTAGLPTYQVPAANGIINADDLATTAPVGVVINEIAVDKDGFDGPYEYIELRNTTASPVSLANVKVVSVESEGNATPATTITTAVWTANGILTLSVPVGAGTPAEPTTAFIDRFFVGDQIALSGFSGSVTIDGSYTIQSIRRLTTTGSEIFTISVAFTSDPGSVTPGTVRNTDFRKPGTFDVVFDLTALNGGTPVTIPANGYVLIKSPNHTVSGLGAETVVLNDSRLSALGGILENGANSFLLVYSPTALTQAATPSGGFYELAADYDQDNNGSLEALPTGAVLLDGFGWGAGTGDINYGTFLTSRYTDNGTPGFASRGTGDTTPFSTNAWRTGEAYFANPPVHDYAVESAAAAERRLDYANSNAPAGSALTPGAANSLAASAAGGVRFVGSTSVSVAETGGTTITFTVERVDGAAGAATVTWTITNGTTQNADWGNGSGGGNTGTVVFADGESGRKTFSITINDTAGYEGRENLFVDLTTSAGVVIAPSRATVTILDDDAVAGDIPAGILLNEVLVNPSGSDEPNEYVELINTTGAAVTLRNVYFVSFEGDSDAERGAADVVIDLNDVTIPAGGTWVIRAPDSTIYSGSNSFLTTLFDNSGGVLENGSNTFALVWSPAALIEGTDYDALPATAGNDGTLELPTVGSAAAAKVLDSVAFTDFGSTDVYYGDTTKAILLQPGSTPDGATRVVGNTTANNAASWYNADVIDTNVSNSLAYNSNISSTAAGLNGPGAPLPASPAGYTGFTAVPSGAVLTPGTANYTTPSTGVFSFAESTFAVTEGNSDVTLTVTVNRTGGTGAADVTWSVANILTGLGFATTGSDTSGALTGTLNFTGSDTSKTFTVTITGDTAVEGNEVLGLALSGATNGATIDSRSLLQPATTAAFNAIRYATTAVILDNDTATALQGLVINEVKVDMAGSDGPFEYIEVRGTPGAVLPAGTYLVSVEGDNGSTFSTTDAAQGLQWDKMGTFDFVFDLSGLTLGSNGLLIIKSSTGGHTVIDAATTVVTDTRLDASGGILENGSNSFLLISSPTALTQATQAGGGVYELASDYDRDEDGTLEALPSGAVILDGIGWSNPNNGDQAYGTYLSYPFFSFAPPAAATRLASNANPGDKDGWRFGEIIFDVNTQLTYDPTAGSNNVDTTLTGRALTPGGANFDSADTTPPTTTSFVRQNPTAATTNADTLVFRATFSEALLNVDTADFAVNSTTTATVTNVTLVSPGVYDVTVSGGNLAGFNGTVNLNLSGSQNITDVAGNPLPAGEPTTDETYTLDNTAPTVVITDNVSGGPIASGATVTYTLTFSEPVTGLELADITNGAASSPAAGTFGSLAGGPTVYTVVFTSTGTAGGNLRLRISNQGAVIQDAVTNPLATPADDDTTITVNAAATTLQVGTISQLGTPLSFSGFTGSGFAINFNSPVSIDGGTPVGTNANDGLNLYTGDIPAVLGARDVEILFDPTGNDFTSADVLSFGPAIQNGTQPGATGDELRFSAFQLDSDTVVLLQSGPNRVAASQALTAGAWRIAVKGGTSSDSVIKTSDSTKLDGNANGTVDATDDYVGNVTVAATPSGAVTVSIGDVVRGPGQTYDILLVISDATDVTSVDLGNSNGPTVAGIVLPSWLSYDTSAGSQGFIVNPATGASAAFSATTGIMTMSSSSPFTTTAGPMLLGSFRVKVAGLTNPGTAPDIGTKGLIDIRVDSVGNTTFQPKPANDDDGLAVAAYPGDVSAATGVYNGIDVSQIQSFITSSVKAFALYQNLDPRVITDVDLNGATNGIDVSNLQGRIVSNPASVVPTLPSGSGGVPVYGADPKVFVAPSLQVAPGQTGFLLPILVTNTDSVPITVAAGDIALNFDTSRFTFVGMDAGPVGGQGGFGQSIASQASFSIAGNEVQGGLVAATASAASGPTLAVGETRVLYYFKFNVKSTAPLGNSPFNIRKSEPVGGNPDYTILGNNSFQQLVLVPAPSDAFNASAEDSNVLVTQPSARVFVGPGPLVSNIVTFAGSPNTQVVVPVSVDVGGTAQAIATAQAAIKFDPAKLSVATVTAGNVTSGANGFSLAFNVPTPGLLVITASSAAGPTVAANTTDTLFNVTFNVLGAAQGGDVLAVNITDNTPGDPNFTILGNNSFQEIPLSPAQTDNFDQDVDGRIAIQVTLNQPPFVNVPGSSLTPAANSQKALAGVPFSLTAPITVSDPNAADNIQVALGVPTGTLTLGSTAGLTVSGNGTGSVVITGSQTNLTAALATLSYLSPAAFTGNVLLTVVANDQSTNFGGAFTDTKFVNLTVVGLRVSEVVIEDVTGTNEYVEIFSTVPNYTIPAGTYLVGLEGDAAENRGAVTDTFDLGGFRTGSNGYLALAQLGSGYGTQLAPGANVVGPGTYLVNAPSVGTGNTRAGFGNGAATGSGAGASTVGVGTSRYESFEGSGVFKTNVHRADQVNVTTSTTIANRATAGTGLATDIENGSISFLLIANAGGSAPAIGTDYDTANTGTLAGVPGVVLDSVGTTDGGAGDTAYGAINFLQLGVGSTPSGATNVTVAFSPIYVGRVGQSLGSSAAAWVGGTLAGTAPNFTLATSSNAFLLGAPLNHVAGPNAWLPTVTSVLVNSTDVDPQRSQIFSIQVSFSGIVFFTGGVDLDGNLNNAGANFSLVRGPAYGGGAVDLAGTVDNSSGFTVVNLYFTGGTNGVSPNSFDLADGRYVFTTNGLAITQNGNQIDAAGTGVAGSSRTDSFHRFFGDYNGNGQIDDFDWANYLAAENSVSGGAGAYNFAFDFDSDGDVDAADDAEFYGRLFTELP